MLTYLLAESVWTKPASLQVTRQIDSSLFELEGLGCTGHAMKVLFEELVHAVRHIDALGIDPVVPLVNMLRAIIETIGDE